MGLVWRLLRQHISIGQFVGFFFANLFGMFIVLLGIQFYNDVIPVFTAEDSFMKADYVIISKKIGTASTISGASNTFSDNEIDDVRSQNFIKDTGIFTGNDFRVSATMGVSGMNILNSEIFLQSVPDRFVDTSLDSWTYTDGSKEVPIIIPRTYINMYNFGFAQNRSLPKISDGLVGMIDFHLFIYGNGQDDEYKGKVVGFTNRMNEILVPEKFMKWANEKYASKNASSPNRLIVEVTNPTDENIAKYVEKKGYEIDNDKLNAEKTTYFLRMIVLIVLAIGLVISVLSFYILMLSIYLLVQKNAYKLENLLLIGYSPLRVAMPYQLLTIGLNLLVLVIALVVLVIVRKSYMDIIYVLFPQVEDCSMIPAVLTGLVLFLVVTLINQIAIYGKVMNIWKRKE